MSGIFRQGLGKGQLERSATYKPGVAQVDQRFITRVIQEFLAADFPAKYQIQAYILHRSTGLAERLLETPKADDFNPQAFLDELAHRLAIEGRPNRGRKDIFSHPEYLLDPMLQVLYNRGYNGLLVDAVELEPSILSSTGKYLAGKPGELLTYEYNGDLQSCGEDSQYCHITSRKPVTKVGYGAENSVFRINARVSGWGSAPKDDPRYFIGKLADDRSLMLESVFWRRGNTLYLPDEDGNWEEVGDLNRVKE